MPELKEFSLIEEVEFNSDCLNAVTDVLQDLRAARKSDVG
jgi:hypothetical protein